MSIAEPLPEALPEVPQGNLEQLDRFEATPEAIQTLLGRDIDMIRQQILEGEQLDGLATELVEAILENRVDYHESFPQLAWDEDVDDVLEGKLKDLLLSQLDQQQMLLRDDAEAMMYRAGRLDEIQNDPEKKGLFSRALSKIKQFAWDNKVLTGLLVLALAAGGIAGGFYLAGEWEALMTFVGASAQAGAADATGVINVLEGAGFEAGADAAAAARNMLGN